MTVKNVHNLPKNINFAGFLLSLTNYNELLIHTRNSCTFLLLKAGIQNIQYDINKFRIGIIMNNQSKHVKLQRSGARVTE